MAKLFLWYEISVRAEEAETPSANDNPDGRVQWQN